ncbi:MAG: SDR family NAD(P)-dependent oxidoreductase [Alphaproteobacteria bacterium]
MNISDKTILITGAAGGLGRLFINELLEEDVKSVIALDVNTSGLADINDDRLYSFACDVSDEKQVFETLTEIYTDHPDIDVLVNNAGILHSAPLVNMLEKDDASLHASAESFNHCLRVNLHSVFYVSQFVGRKMMKTRTKGVIVNISSVSAQGNAGQSAYSASKAGVEALTHVWAKELAGFGIRSVAIAPGYMDTPSTHKAVSESQLKEITARIPLRALGNPDCIVAALWFAIENDYLNGTVLHVDGGLRT